jgi:hypothetical protein
MSYWKTPKELGLSDAEIGKIVEKYWTEDRLVMTCCAPKQSPTRFI